MQIFKYFLFAVAGGLTLSGIVANLYRLVARKPHNRAEKVIFYAVMALAGPSVLFDNATRSFRSRDCSRTAYGFAVAIAGYWAFALGLALIDVGLML
jgi:hypothetical protein